MSTAMTKAERVRTRVDTKSSLMAPLATTSHRCASVSPGGGSSTGLTHCAAITSCHTPNSSSGPINGSSRASKRRSSALGIMASTHVDQWLYRHRTREDLARAEDVEKLLEVYHGAGGQR